MAISIQQTGDPELLPAQHIWSSANATKARFYRFGCFHIDLLRRQLFKEDVPLRLGNRAMELLLALIEKPGEVVSASALLKRVWPDTAVCEGNLRVQLHVLRKALEDEAENSGYIVNAPGQGYRFCAPVAVRNEHPKVSGAHFGLPAPLARIIGRTCIISELAIEVSEQRFLTIVGAGGIGKTTVAVAVAHEVSDQFTDGICFLDLSSLTSEQTVVEALSQSMGLSPAPSHHRREIIDVLQGRQMLIVLDNCEHVVSEVADLAEALLKSVSGIHVLTTSREPLWGDGERLRRLPPLQTPPAETTAMTAEEALTFPAVQLFVERAQTVRDTFMIADEEALAVGALCRRLDGMPLAIELAAARVDVFGISEMATRFDSCLSILTRGLRTAKARQQTLRATLDWSFALLTASEQTLLLRLSVFQATFSREAAIQVAGFDGLGKEAISEELSNLISKSLIVSELVGNRILFRLLDTTRAYALGLLEQDATATEVLQRYAFHVGEAVKELASSREPKRTDLFGQGRTAIEDVRSAIHWALTRQNNVSLGLELTTFAAFIWKDLFLTDDFNGTLELAYLPQQVYKMKSLSN